MRTLLIIDDDADIRETFATILTREDYHVLLAGDGVEGLDLLCGDPRPDAVLLDLMLPDLDGWGFLRAKSADVDLVRIPVIVMTALPASEARFSGIEGALMILHKPVDLDKLLRTLERACTCRPKHATTAIAPGS